VTQVTGLQSIIQGLQQGSGASIQTNVMAATRYVIGISGIDVNSVTYIASSEIISPWYNFTSAPSALMLQVDQSVPADTDIQYFISADGIVWAPIGSLGTGAGDIVYVAVSPALQVTSSFDGTSSTLTTNSQVTSFQVRAVMQSSNSIVTPILKSYELISLPKSIAVNWN
jgi:hypothetical protein